MRRAARCRLRNSCLLYWEHEHSGGNDAQPTRLRCSITTSRTLLVITYTLAWLLSQFYSTVLLMSTQMPIIAVPSTYFANRHARQRIHRPRYQSAPKSSTAGSMQSTGLFFLRIASTPLESHSELDKDNLSTHFGTITTVNEELCLREVKSWGKRGNGRRRVSHAWHKQMG